MDIQEGVALLFTIAKEIKRSLEHPIILLTQKDYADSIFNSFVDMRAALLQHAAPDRLLEIITNFHLEWLEAVKDIECFKKRIKDIPREVIYKTVEFTKESVANRRKYFKLYIDQLHSTMTAEERDLMHADLEIIGDMYISLNSVLQDKLKCVHNLADQTEYYIKVSDEAEELMNWLDSLNDHLALQFSKMVGFKEPQLMSDLTTTLNQIIDEVAASTDPNAQKIIQKIQSKRQKFCCVVQLKPADELEMRKILEKIRVLDARIERLKIQNSSAVMALQHKTLYLEERLNSLENLKISLYTLKSKRMEDINTVEAPKCQQIHIFDHLLPAQERCRLVEELTRLWNNALGCVQEGKSLISILSVADIKEVFSDEIGKFTVDKYGRKLYKSATDDKLYQLNHKNQLVSIKDDDKHVYFYDDCGRYYLSDNKQRIYKAHDNASEYLINREGILMKYKEIKQGIEYVYDCLGRYYKDKDGKKIYIEQGSTEKYEHDGLGNLVRIRSEPLIAFKACPLEPVVTEENKYLQRVVGKALKKCLADVILHQPLDPILYLANSLEKYRLSMEELENRQQDEQLLRAERALHMGPQEPAYSTVSSSGVCDESTSKDYNFINYQT